MDTEFDSKRNSSSDGDGASAVDLASEPVVEMQGICTQFGRQVVHQGLDLVVRRGEILAVVGGSGSGKSVLLREMILLQRPTAGVVRLFGQDVTTLTTEQGQALRQRWGVMFQKGGLFSALTVRENVGLPMREHSSLSPALIDGLAEWKLALTGLPDDTGCKYPSALSGGMLKRAAMARALALDPELLFLDEPTSGLDPASATGIGDLILQTHALFEPTIVLVTHDLDLMWRVSDRVAVLGEGRVLAVGSMGELAQHPHPLVQSYFVDVRQARSGLPTHATRKSPEPVWKTK